MYSEVASEVEVGAISISFVTLVAFVAAAKLSDVVAMVEKTEIVGRRRVSNSH